MSEFADRATRKGFTFPLEFVVDGERIPGTCENLSESGLLATFAKALEVWERGEVDLHFGIDLIGVRARVARVDGLKAGLSFTISDD
ncbi:MAG: PilZ domain-containing protein [Janthinobacterium lividum]